VSDTEANNALLLEAQTCGMAKQPDTPEQFQFYWQTMAPLMTMAGASVAEPWRRKKTRGQTTVGFFMPTGTMLAHSVNLLTYLNANSNSPGSEIEPVIFIGGKDGSPEFKEAYALHTVVYCGKESHLATWKEVRRVARLKNIAAMVFVSVVQGMAFAVAMGVAPKTIWWAHKWHGLQDIGLDGYLDACHPFREAALIGNYTWQCTYTALPDLFEPKHAAEAGEIRQGMDVGVVFGWMGRSEKITVQYLDCVVQILRRVPDSIYVYTGREEISEIEHLFQQAGLGDRIAFLGWVDTRLWAQVIDVYLDTFPFQSGHCAYEAMAASKPVVWLHDYRTAEEQSASGLIIDNWDNRADDLFGYEPWARSPEAYVSLAVILATVNYDHGSRYRSFLEAYMMDAPRMARSVNAGILEVLNG